MTIISPSENKQLPSIPKETISQIDTIGQTENLKINLITFKEKKISFHVSKIQSPKFP